MTWFLSATVVCASVSVGSYYWQHRLSGVIAASFAISECKCGVYFQGCHGNHCICGGSDWCCRPSKTVLFLSRGITWYALPHTHTHTQVCAATNTQCEMHKNHQNCTLFVIWSTTINWYASSSAVSKSFSWNLPTQTPHFSFLWGFFLKCWWEMHQKTTFWPIF